MLAPTGTTTARVKTIKMRGPQREWGFGFEDSSIGGTLRILFIHQARA
jgi:hypothetical protein